MGAQAESAVLAGGPLGDLARPGAQATRAVDLGPLPPGYDLHRVALSHSHVAFAPSGYDPAGRSYSQVLPLPGRGATRVVVRQDGDRLRGRLHDPGLERGADPVGEQDLRSLRAQLRHVLAADDHLTDLRAAASACATVLPSVAREVARGGGRLLRAPTAWEDLVGVLLSTGWSWAAARAAVERLVLRYGDEGGAGERSFPTSQAVAAADEETLAADTGAGRRAGPLLALARAVDSGCVDPQAWVVTAPDDRRAGAALEDGEVRRALLHLRGFGPWSADVALGLLGRPRGLALDGWARGKLARLLDRPGLTAGDVAERYAPLGRWAGTGCWLELTADWFGPAAPRPRSGGAA